MNISDLSIRRPVLAIVMSLLILLFGAVGLSRLSVREYPDIEAPIVSVVTLYPGASPEVIERTVTEIIEDEVVSVAGIKSLVSNSRDEVSVITVEFDLDKDIDVGAQEVRDRVSRARSLLPDDIEEPLISKEDADAQAIMWISLYGDKFTPVQITDYADRYIVDQLQTVDGVGRVILGGGREYAMRLWLDPQKMASRGITIGDIRDALSAQNVEIPSGRIEGKEREFTIKTLGKLKTPEAFNRLIIREVDGVPIYLQDVGNAEVGPKTQRSLVRFNGQTAIGLGIVKQSKANTLTVADGVKEKLKVIEKTLPRGLKMETAFDSSIFIDRSIDEVVMTLYIAGFLVIVVIALFLGRFRYTLIPAVTIPISIIGALALLDWFGFTINNLTLLALILAIGLVVDDAIVVLENIVRHIEMGKKPFQAALEGMKEIGFAVVATTIVLVSVFLPLAYMEGAVGQLFYEFAIALAGSVVISGFVALTLTPMMCSRWLRPPAEERHSVRQNFVRQVMGATVKLMDWSNQYYERMLHWTMGNKGLTMGAVGLLLVLTAAIMMMPGLLKRDFLPTEDRAFLMTFIKAPEGASLAYTEKALKQAEDIYRSVPEVSKFFGALAISQQGPGEVNSGIMFVPLKLWEERHRKQQDIVASLFPQMLAIPEALVFPINPPSGPTRGWGQPFQMVIQGYDLQALDGAAQRIMARIPKEVPGLIQVDSDLKLNKPQLDIEVLRERAADAGVSVRDLANTMQILLGGLDLSTFDVNNKTYDVMVQMPQSLRESPDVLNSLYVRAKNGEMMTLSSLVSVKETVAPASLNHYDRMRSVTLSGAILPFISLGDAIQGVEKIARQEMDPDMTIKWSGDSRQLLETEGTIYFIFMVALLVVYLTLCAQFESFLHPFVIMLTVPLAFAGAIIALFVCGSSLNVYSQIGIILLVGLVTKNGILIVEYANQIFESNPAGGVADAVSKAASIRYRPILMTSICTILGAVPLALAHGAGAESRQSLGIAIVGGMLFSTFLTLFIVPIAYTLLNRWRETQHHHGESSFTPNGDDPYIGPGTPLPTP